MPGRIVRALCILGRLFVAGLHVHEGCMGVASNVIRCDAARYILVARQVVELLGLVSSYLNGSYKYIVCVACYCVMCCVLYKWLRMLGWEGFLCNNG